MDGIFRNEFAMVSVSRDLEANGVRLLIYNVVTGDHIYLDPLELETLTRLPHAFFAPVIAAGNLEDDGTDVVS